MLCSQERNVRNFFRTRSITMASFSLLKIPKAAKLKILAGFLCEFNISDMILSRELFLYRSVNILHSNIWNETILERSTV